MEDADDYAIAFETELILLVQQGLGLPHPWAARVPTQRLYPRLLRAVNCEVGRRLELSPDTTAVFHAVFQRGMERHQHAFWRRFLPWVPGGRLRKHEAIVGRAGLVAVVDRDNDNFCRFIEVANYALTGTRIPAGGAR